MHGRIIIMIFEAGGLGVHVRSSPGAIGYFALQSKIFSYLV